MGNIFKKTSDGAYGDANQSRQIPFAVVEAYKTIRTNLIYAMSQSSKRSFVVSSSNQGEGKSTTSVNIAIAFSPPLKSFTFLNTSSPLNKNWASALLISV